MDNSVAGDAALGGGVRRHHTITAATRLGRTGTRDEISEQDWNDDEIVSENRVGGVGAVGEKGSLHRQASLPTRYHRQFQNTSTSSGSPLNSLSTIAGHDGDEEEWVKGINEQHAEQQTTIPISPLAGTSQMAPSPPPADSGVRRHVSLTYGAQARANKQTLGTLKRSDTLQTPLPAHPPEGPADAGLYIDETSQDEPGSFENEEHFNKTTQHASSQPQYGRSSPWSQQGNDWRSGQMDDVARALSSMDINNQQQYPANYSSTSPHPPRFNQPGASQYRSPSNTGGLPESPDSSRQAQDGRRTPGGSPWNDQRSLNSRRSNPNMHYGYQQGHSKSPSSGSNVSGHGGNQSQVNAPIPSVPPIPQQYLQGQSQPRPGLGLATNVSNSPSPATGHTGQTPVQGFVSTPIDVPTLIATKGYNPSHFDTRPVFARYFVIKSYTEDDVHKSLKYEIWSSTDPGNKRLDKAFKDCAGRGPIYLFFSVNASGHFCGMAEMLTPVDYTRSSTVWASDKWKGVFKVRWIFVRDIPNVTLRHIKLNNTQEKKPVTNSRDTQELLPDAGQEMLRIFHTHPARTSLLQDFAFYELQAMQKMQAQQSHGSGSPASNSGSALQSPQMQAQSPNLGHRQASPQPQFGQQQAYHAQNPNALAYTMPTMSPVTLMHAQYNGGLSPAQSQAMHNSVMRNPSPSNDNGRW